VRSLSRIPPGEDLGEASQHINPFKITSKIKNMKTKNLLITCVIAATLGLSLNACKKDSSTTPNNSADEQTGVTLSTSSTSSEMMYDDAFDVATQSSEESGLSTNSVSSQTVDAMSTNTTSSYTTTAGATITVTPSDPSVFPKTMTIDYGAGVTSANGVTRKGQIIVTLSGKLRVAGSVISVTFNNYFVNSYGLTGTYSLTPQVVSGGGVNFAATVTNGSITFPNGQVSTYSGTETLTQVAGLGTTTVTDDTYNITGNFSYSSTTTGSITGTITTPLVKSADCKDITTGIIAFTYKSLNGTLDFGSGTCDDQATVKFGLTTKTITLPI
jgi:hypothetical protein